MLEYHDHGMGTFTPARPIPPCRWERFDLLCVHAGRLQLSFDHAQPATTLELEPAMGVLIYPDTRFAGRALSPRCRASVQHFGLTRPGQRARLPFPLQRLVGLRRGYEAARFTHFPAVARDIERSIELAFAPQDETTLAQRLALLTLIISQWQAEPAVRTPRRQRGWPELDAWLRTQLQRPVNVEQMARQMDLSPSHFRQRFTQEFGLSPGKYLQRLRFQEAMRLLRETDLPIKTIARKLHYPDLPNFYRAFRAAVGATPARYRTHHSLRG